MGFVGVFVHQMLQAHALTLTSAIEPGWLIGVTPIWSAVLAAFFLRERFGSWQDPRTLLGALRGRVARRDPGRLLAASSRFPRPGAIC